MTDDEIIAEAFDALHSNLCYVSVDGIEVESTPRMVYVAKYPEGQPHTIHAVLWRVAISPYVKPWVIWRRGGL